MELHYEEVIDMMDFEQGTADHVILEREGVAYLLCHGKEGWIVADDQAWYPDVLVSYLMENFYENIPAWEIVCCDCDKVEETTLLSGVIVRPFTKTPGILFPERNDYQLVIKDSQGNLLPGFVN